MHKGSRRPEELPSYWEMTLEYIYPILIQIEYNRHILIDVLYHNEVSGILDAVKTGSD